MREAERRGVLLLVALAATCAGCGTLKHLAVDGLMGFAYRPRRAELTVRLPGKPLRLYAGDFHCHVAPPDRPPHVVRGLEETLDRAWAAKLDFVVLTPHVRAHLQETPDRRSAVLNAHAQLRERLRRLDTRGVLVIPGFEYTDFRAGHVGLAFGSFEAALAPDVPPEAFFERYVASGGLISINHPLLTPIDFPVRVASWDLSWHPLFSPGPFPPGIASADQLAQSFEAFNLAITHLRDRFLLGDPEDSIRRSLARFDERILSRGRRMAPVGGSDSHGHHLIASTFVLATALTPSALRDAVLEGRTCVRGPKACTVAVRIPGWRPVAVGGALPAARTVQVRVLGGDGEVFVNGASAGAIRRSTWTDVTLRPDCSLVRVRVDEGYSGPVYVGCAFAPPRR